MKYLFLFLLPCTALANFSSQSYKAGFRSSFVEGMGKFQNSLFYYEIEYDEEEFKEEYTLKSNFKLRAFDFISTDEEVMIDPYDISLEWLRGKFSFQIGFVRYRFSESFGVQLLDIANPRDYSEFIFNDLSWSKRAVFGLNSSYDFDGVLSQFFLTLWPNGDRLPYKETYYDTSGNLQYEGGVYSKKFFEDIEYGARFSKAFENSLNLSFLYYHHEKRPIILILDGLKLVPDYQMVDSFGASFSFLLSDFVIRGDVLLTIEEEKDHYQSLVGIDRVFENFNFGLQSFKDYNSQNHFLGSKFEFTKYSSFVPSMQVFYNTEVYERWFQLKNEIHFDFLSLSINYDQIEANANKNSLFALYKRNDRYLIDLSFKY